MRILQVNHQYPPHSLQGSELHCLQLARSLAATDEVAVLHVSEVSRPYPPRVERSSPDGFPVFHCIDGGHYARLADWPNPVLRRQFGEVLADWRPEVVHFHNYLSLGDDLPSRARASGAAIVYTLHDFGLVCPNHLLLRPDLRPCEKGDADFFGPCCPTPLRVSGGRIPAIRRRVPSLARWQAFASQQGSPVVRGMLEAALAVPLLVSGDPSESEVARKRDFFFEHTRRIFADVDLFLAPSEFLLRKFVACGLPAERARHVGYGTRPSIPRPKAPSPDGRLRFGFLGAFHAHKGLELLVRAFEGLGDRARLDVHGSAFGSPVGGSLLRRVQREAPAGVVFHGAYRNEDLERILSAIDVVVVPSLWFENSPFTIHEALACGVPVVTGDDGGMAELVRDGVEGLRFRIGDAADLRRKLESLVERPERVEELRRNLAVRPASPTPEAQAAVVRAEYRRLLDARAYRAV